MPARHFLALWLVVLYVLSITKHIYAHPSSTTNVPARLSKRMQRWPFGARPLNNLVDRFEGIDHHPPLNLDENGQRSYANTQYAGLQPANGRDTNVQRLATPDDILEAENLRLNNGMPVPHNFQEGVNNIVRVMVKAHQLGSDLKRSWLAKWIEQAARVVPHTDGGLRNVLDLAVSEQVAEYLDVQTDLERFDKAQMALERWAAEDGLSFQLSTEHLRKILERLDRRRLRDYRTELRKMLYALRNLDENVADSKGIASSFNEKVSALPQGRSSSNTAIRGNPKLSPWGLSLARKAAEAQQRFTRLLQQKRDDRAALLPPVPAQDAINSAQPGPLPWNQDGQVYDASRLVQEMHGPKRGQVAFDRLGLITYNDATWSLVCWAFNTLDKQTFASGFLRDLFEKERNYHGEASDGDLIALYEKYRNGTGRSPQTDQRYRGHH